MITTSKPNASLCIAELSATANCTVRDKLVARLPSADKLLLEHFLRARVVARFFQLFTITEKAGIDSHRVLSYPVTYMYNINNQLVPFNYNIVYVKLHNIV